MFIGCGALRFFSQANYVPYFLPVLCTWGKWLLALIGTPICHHQAPVVHYRAGIQGGWTAEEEIGALFPLNLPPCVFISPMVFGVMLHSQIETTPGHDGLLDLLLSFSSCDSKKQNFYQFLSYIFYIRFPRIHLNFTSRNSQIRIVSRPPNDKSEIQSRSEIATRMFLLLGHLL